MNPEDIQALQDELRARHGVPDLTIVYSAPRLQPRHPYHTVTARWQKGEKLMQCAYQWHDDRIGAAWKWISEMVAEGGEA